LTLSQFSSISTPPAVLKLTSMSRRLLCGKDSSSSGSQVTTGGSSPHSCKISCAEAHMESRRLLCIKQQQRQAAETTAKTSELNESST
jgi:hypothetical protein